MSLLYCLLTWSVVSLWWFIEYSTACNGQEYKHLWAGGPLLWLYIVFVVLWRKARKMKNKTNKWSLRPVCRAVKRYQQKRRSL